jgi:glycosyltransferase involved in cell wall biosynthesis
MNCLLVGSLDPLTERLRTGAALRYRYPPNGVTYQLQTEHLGYPKYLAHYSLKLLSTPLSSARLLAESFFPLDTKNSSLIHSFYWTIHRYNIRWIHENDQSLSQYFSNYIRFEGFVSRRIVEVSAAILNNRQCKALVVWSNWAKNGYANDGVDSNKIAVIPPPFPLVYDKQKHESVNILFLGRDYNRKGGDIAVKVFKRLSKELNGIRLIYVGKVPDPKVSAFLKGNSKVSYYEFATQADLMHRIFPVSDILLLPCRAEAYGMSVLEAMSRGIPVVSSRISALPEILKHGSTGYLCKPEDIDSFAAFTERLAANATLMLDFGQEARRVVSEKFNPQTIGQQLQKLYAEAVS